MISRRIVPIVALVCGVPVLIILAAQVHRQGQIEKIDFAGCYATSETEFRVERARLVARGQSIASARLTFVKHVPYLEVTPGIDVDEPGKRIIRKAANSPEFYPIDASSATSPVIKVAATGGTYFFKRSTCQH